MCVDVSHWSDMVSSRRQVRNNIVSQLGVQTELTHGISLRINASPVVMTCYKNIMWTVHNFTHHQFAVSEK